MHLQILTMRKALFLLAAIIFSIPAICQKEIIAGPMLGPVELRDAKIWVEVSSDAKTVSIQYNKKSITNIPGSAGRNAATIQYKGSLGNDFNPIQFTIGGLEPNTTYEYRIIVNGRPTNAMGQFVTKDLWQWRKPAPDFSFLTGSCSYTNERIYDRPGTPYGKDSSIFETMAKEKAAFMLWLGDSWYTREVDYYSEWGLRYRASHDRAVGVLQPFLKAMPHFATWDDHDYGPNDIGSNYVLKDVSRDIFNRYFCNPSSGENGQGIYTMTSWGDVDLFLTDNRWWRSADRMSDSVDGKPNIEKTMLGKQQMTWLKNSLLFSSATFKIVVVGSQVLNPVSPFNKWSDFPAENQELMKFLKDNRINGVLFLTGDRHHSEIIKIERQGTYPLYDITVSPLTSSTHTFGAAEKNNPYRVFALDQFQNYGRFSFSGARGSRTLLVEFIGIKGDKLGQWSINEKDLKTPQ